MNRFSTLKHTLICIGVFLFSDCFAEAGESPLLNEIMRIESQKKFRPLTGVTGFRVNYVFFDKGLDKTFEESLMKSLQKIGIVLADNDSKLTVAEREEKTSRKKLGMFFTANEVICEKSSFLESKKHQIIQLCLKISDGRLIDERIQVIPIWEKELFLDLSNDQNEHAEQATKAINSLIDAFMKDYKIVNSEKTTKAPMFFMSPPIYRDLL